MRCKVGDLAVFVRSRFGNEGAMVEVVAPATESGWWEVVLLSSAMSNDGNLYPPGSSGDARDCDLMPIRDPGPKAVDEMIQKLGKPEDLKVAA